MIETETTTLDCYQAVIWPIVSNRVRIQVDEDEPYEVECSRIMVTFPVEDDDE